MMVGGHGSLGLKLTASVRASHTWPKHVLHKNQHFFGMDSISLKLPPAAA